MSGALVPTTGTRALSCTTNWGSRPDPRPADPRARLVRAVAKGIRRVGSRFGAKLDRFCRVNVQIYSATQRHPLRRGLATVTDAATVATYAPQIVADVDRFYAGWRCWRSPRSPSRALSRRPDTSLTCWTPRSPIRGRRHLPPRTTADRFVLQALGLAGWAPSLVDLRPVWTTRSPPRLPPLAGGAVCTTCRPRARSPSPPQAVRVLWLLSRTGRRSRPRWRPSRRSPPHRRGRTCCRSPMTIGRPCAAPDRVSLQGVRRALTTAHPDCVWPGGACRRTLSSGTIWTVNNPEIPAALIPAHRPGDGR